MNNNILHPCFKINSTGFQSKVELLHFANAHVKGIHSFLSNWFDKSDFIDVKTSGSTGKPKTIHLKKEHMAYSAKATGSYFELGKNTSALLCLNMQFIAGKMMLVRAMILGWHLDIKDSNLNPLINLEKNYDFSAMAPLQLYNSLDRVSQIKKLIIGGGVISRELKSKIKLLNTPIYQTYGMTETSTHIAIKPLNKSAGLTDKNNYYQTLNHIQIGQDKRGCLIIDAPKITDKELITNDIVKIISKNKFKWLGRFDHIINSGGIKLVPEQIEEKLEKLIAQRFFVYGQHDKILGERLVLVVEGSKQDNLLKKITIFQKENLNTLHRYEIPKKIYFVENFIETQTKKINRIRIIDLINS